MSKCAPELVDVLKDVLGRLERFADNTTTVQSVHAQQLAEAYKKVLGNLEGEDHDNRPKQTLY